MTSAISGTSAASRKRFCSGGGEARVVDGPLVGREDDREGGRLEVEVALEGGERLRRLGLLGGEAADAHHAGRAGREGQAEQHEQRPERDDQLAPTVEEVAEAEK